MASKRPHYIAGCTATAATSTSSSTFTGVFVRSVEATSEGRPAAMIEAQHLSKRYGAKLAVNDLSFTAQPGTVTGFLGPNGAGKSTTMRMILGLDVPTSGRATINGKPLAQHTHPLHEVGALLEARAVHTGRSARNHLRAMAATAGIGRRRVQEVIDFTGLTDVAGHRAKTFSLGMGQRLGIASALLGDPQTLILDEPVNGLDPDGVRWIRTLLRGLADEGRTIFLSSHLMSEMAMTADHVIVVGRGALVRDQSMKDLIAAESRPGVRVRCLEPAHLADLLGEREGVLVHRLDDDDALEIEGMTTDEVGIAAGRVGIILLELTARTASLEDAYMALTGDSVEYASRSVAVDPETHDLDERKSAR
jgi:ABC-2 type transport system ATP-binding protein